MCVHVWLYIHVQVDGTVPALLLCSPLFAIQQKLWIVCWTTGTGWTKGIGAVKLASHSNHLHRIGILEVVTIFRRIRNNRHVILYHLHKQVHATIHVYPKLGVYTTVYNWMYKYTVHVTTTNNAIFCSYFACYIWICSSIEKCLNCVRTVMKTAGTR